MHGCRFQSRQRALFMDGVANGLRFIPGSCRLQCGLDPGYAFATETQEDRQPYALPAILIMEIPLAAPFARCTKAGGAIFCDVQHVASLCEQLHTCERTANANAVSSDYVS
jgi:hypothetical protein